jgi:hypothetical protein
MSEYAFCVDCQSDFFIHDMKPIDITNRTYICFRCLDYRGGTYRKEDNAVCQGCLQTVFARTLIIMCTECNAFRCLQCIHDGNACDCNGFCYHCNKKVNIYDDGLPCEDCHKRYC